MCTCTLFIVILVIAVLLFSTWHVEGFYIEPNTIIGAAMPASGMFIDPNTGQYDYDQPLELEGPGNAAWSGY